jgi:hypothetical protein
MNAALPLAWVRYAIDRLAWPGLLGLALLIAAASTFEFGVVPLREHNDELQQKIDRLRERAAAQPVALPESEIRKLAALPSGDELMPLVAAVHAAAARREVSLDQGEYQWQPESGGRAGRYRMNFPVRGEYMRLRGWVADVTAAWPAMRLDDIEFRRDNIGNPSLEAQVRFTVRVEEAAP